MPTRILCVITARNLDTWQKYAKVNSKVEVWLTRTSGISEETTHLEEDVVFNVKSKTTPPYQVVVEINEQPISMEIDTGAAVSIMSRENWEAKFAAVPLAKPTLSLRTYTAENGSFRRSFCTCEV